MAIIDLCLVPAEKPNAPVEIPLERLAFRMMSFAGCKIKVLPLPLAL
jgi:hypothetical protein